MNKQELIDKAVDEWLKPDATVRVKSHGQVLKVYRITEDSGVRCNDGKCYCRSNLEPHGNGWCNGYKYGVEYETNGKKPDLPDDVLVDIKCEEGSNAWQYNTNLKVSEVLWSRDKYDDSFIPASHFKIIDQRYKPVETAPDTDKQVFIEAPMFKGLPNEKSWHEKGELPPVGWHGEVTWGAKTSWHECVMLPSNRISYNSISGWVVNDVRNLEFVEFRPLKTERERFVEAAIACLTEFKSENQVFGELYDAGFKAPEVVE